MILSAPGKLVISGAYAVLYGAPALVSAVNRRVVVDTSRHATFETKEVEAGFELLALKHPYHPWFDATALREGDRKLGLGSSAAICAASLCGLWLESQEHQLDSGDRDPAKFIYPIALEAHRKAQGGGSGIDVAAACFGGSLEARILQEPTTSSGSSSHLEVSPVSFPKGLVFETWAMRQSATTSEFVRKIRELRELRPAEFETAIAAQKQASCRAVEAVRGGDALEFTRALRAQVEALSRLGDGAQIPIVLPEVRRLNDELVDGACFIPSGAGGGDVTLYAGKGPSPQSFREQADALGLALVDLELNAPGVRREEG